MHLFSRNCLHAYLFLSVPFATHSVRNARHVSCSFLYSLGIFFFRMLCVSFFFSFIVVYICDHPQIDNPVHLSPQGSMYISTFFFFLDRHIVLSHVNFTVLYPQKTTRVYLTTRVFSIRVDHIIRCVCTCVEQQIVFFI